MGTAAAEPEDFDAVIIGAGLSGINTAYRLQTELPDVRFIVLEARDVIGGTWSFWKYPGARSDSSLAVFALKWHPWPHDADLAEAGLISSYLEEAAAAQGIDRKIRLRHRVVGTNWSTPEQAWTLRVEVGGGESGTATRLLRTRWILGCSGYYDYDKAGPADIPGLGDFAGEVVHPQFWTDDIDYAGKRVVIVGSGATAITLLPAVAKQASHVTMLQRSPSYVLSIPASDRATRFLKRWLPLPLACRLSWWRQMLLESLVIWLFTTFPIWARRQLRAQAKRALPANVPVDVHFNPRYSPFEQRLCMCPDGDFFRALRQPNCDIVTDTIDAVTPTGMRLSSGRELEADMIITATGLYLQLNNGQAPVVDGLAVPLGERYGWRGCMVEGVPNMCLIIGYTGATWTPGADVRCRTVLAIMRHMRRIGATSVSPRMDPVERAVAPRLPVLHNSSGYIVRARDRLPLATGRDPWRSGRSWIYDAWVFRSGGVTKGMAYTVPEKAKNV